MSNYCLDSNVYIQAKNGPYGMDFMPAFWDLLDQQSECGVVYSPKMVFSELANGDDELASWVKERKTTGLFVESKPDVQSIVTQIADYVNRKYPENRVKDFLDKVDPWVIAHAKVNTDAVVTQETLVDEQSRQVKIPNVCKKFGVPYLNMYEMLRALNAKFTLA